MSTVPGPEDSYTSYPTSYDKAESVTGTADRVTVDNRRLSQRIISRPLTEDMDDEFITKHVTIAADKEERDLLEPVFRKRNELRYDVLACFGELIGTFLCELHLPLSQFEHS